MRRRILQKRTRKKGERMTHENEDIQIIKNTLDDLSEETSRHLNDIQKQINSMKKDLEKITPNDEDNEVQIINMTVQCDEDPEELRGKLVNAFTEALNESIKNETDEDVLEDINNKLQFNNLVFRKPNDEDNILELKVPFEAYDEEGDLKESYRKAYKTIIEENRRQHKGTLTQLSIEKDEDKEDNEYDINPDVIPLPQPVSIGDDTTFRMKHLIQDLIDNTGILEEATLIFKKTLTPTILLTLSLYKETLTKTRLTWNIEDYDTEYIKLTLKNN